MPDVVRAKLRGLCGDGPDLLDHGVQPIAAGRRELPIEPELGEKSLDVERENLLGRVVRKGEQQNGDQAADDEGVGVGEEFERRCGPGTSRAMSQA